MADIESKRPTYTVEAIRTDINNGVFLGNAVLDNIVVCLIGMSTEMWAMKRRNKVLEALLAQKGITEEMVEKFVPTEAQTAAWEKERDAFVDLSLGPLANEGFRPVASPFATRG